MQEGSSKERIEVQAKQQEFFYANANGYKHETYWAQMTRTERRWQIKRHQPMFDHGVRI